MPVEIFCCYARKDQSLLSEVITYLAPLKRQGLITIWADTDIGAGVEWEREIKKHLKTAQIILLLVSPDFMASDYINDIELKRAIERHERGEACVIPIILRPVYWQGAPFGKLQALPTNGKPITGPAWHDKDNAFFDVAEGIRLVIQKLTSQQPVTESASPLLKPRTEMPFPVDEHLEPTGVTVWEEPTPQTFQTEVTGIRITLSGEEAALVIYMDSKWRGRTIYLRSGHDLDDYSAQAQVITRFEGGMSISTAIFPRLPILTHLRPAYENQKSGTYIVHFPEFNDQSFFNHEETITLFAGNVAELDWRKKTR